MAKISITALLWSVNVQIAVGEKLSGSWWFKHIHVWNISEIALPRFPPAIHKQLNALWLALRNVSVDMFRADSTANSLDAQLISVNIVGYLFQGEWRMCYCNNRLVTCWTNSKCLSVNSIAIPEFGWHLNLSWTNRFVSRQHWYVYMHFD